MIFFTHLYIVSGSTCKKDTLYSIEGHIFKNKNGIDVEVSKENTDGYKVALKKDDYIVFLILSADEKNVSDITVKWNYSKGLFEVLKTP